MHKRHPGTLAHARWLVPAAALTLFGCPDDELAPLEPCTVAGVTEEITQSGVDTVDLLFVIDNSGSMAEEQANLSEQLPRLVQVLASGDLKLNGKNDKTGEPGKDFQPVSNLHLGVISTDMGVAGVPNIKYCSDQPKGDDGLLIGDVRSTDPTCDGVDVQVYQEFKPPADDTERNEQAAVVAKKFGCVAALGIEGCGFEQQLEAMWKALAPSSDNSFLGGTTGWGDSQQGNNGFLRDDAVLAIIHVSDEEDCSIAPDGAEIFNPTTTDTRFAGEGLNIRCGYHTDDPTLVRPVSRYIDGLKSLKAADKQDRIIFAGIVGVPFKAETLLAADGSQDFDAILKLDEMQFEAGGPKDQADTQAVPSCETENGRADPARRFVSVAKGFGANGVIRSICQSDFSSALDTILNKISKQLSGACLPRALNPNDKGVVECDVVEILAAGRTQSDCSASRGRTYLENREVPEGGERVVCKINQVPVVGGELQSQSPGWYYDNFSDQVTENCPAGSQQRIAFTTGADLAPGAKASFECFSPVGGSATAVGKAAVGSPCDPGNDLCKTARSEEGEDGFKLECEKQTRTCQITCEAASNCPDSWECSAKGYCVNPTCPPTQSTNGSADMMSSM